MSSPRFSTSFHCKQIVYPSQMAAQSQNLRPSSELSYSSPKSERHRLTLSCATSSSQDKFKSFQDPTQKTYSGDIILKHAHCFTQEKPFTPRTLKKECKSTLSTYRYYTPADRKGTEEKTPSIYSQPDTHHRRYNITAGLLIYCYFIYFFVIYNQVCSVPCAGWSFSRLPGWVPSGITASLLTFFCAFLSHFLTMMRYLSHFHIITDLRRCTQNI